MNREPTGADRRNVALYIAIFVLSIVAAALLLFTGAPAWWSLVVFIAIVAGALALLIRWHAGVTAYRCAACDHEFTITPLTDFISPHIMTTKYLRCPQCNRRSWAKILMKE